MYQCGKRLARWGLDQIRDHRPKHICYQTLLGWWGDRYKECGLQLRENLAQLRCGQPWSILQRMAHTLRLHQEHRVDRARQYWWREKLYAFLIAPGPRWDAFRTNLQTIHIIQSTSNKLDHCPERQRWVELCSHVLARIDKLSRRHVNCLFSHTSKRSRTWYCFITLR